MERRARRSVRFAFVFGLFVAEIVWRSTCFTDREGLIQMSADAGTLTYSLKEPFARALELVPRYLANHGLRLAGQLDLSARLERILGIMLPPCRIVFVLPGSGYGIDNVPPYLGTSLPLHVVIAESEPHTLIHIPNRPVPEHSRSAGPDPVSETHARVVETIEAIAMRPSFAA